MQRLTWDEVEAARRTPGRAALLFLTDRCPVGCAHCSVDSRRDSAAITDFRTFTEIIEGLAAAPALDVIGISGGEPMTERRGLAFAAHRLASAGKRVVIYTAGVWATSPDPPEWISGVLRSAACVVLSTDSYHSAHIPARRFACAARAIDRSGANLVVQTLDDPRELAAAHDLLTISFGVSWPQHAEISQVPPLPHGRGAGLFPAAAPPHRMGAQFGTCTVASAPVLRYDGRVSACCNEAVVMGAGPAALRRSVRTRADVVKVFTDLAASPYLTTIATAGLGPLTALPPWRALATKRFPSVCALCWRMVGSADGPREAAMLTLIAAARPR